MKNKKILSKNLRKKILEERLKKIKKLSIILIPIFLLVVAYLIVVPKISLNGKDIVTVEYADTYVDNGATAKYLGKDITNSLEKSGKVDTKKLGEYKVTYTYNHFIIPIKKSRVVNVVDSTKPVIQLTGEKKVIVCPGKKYEEEGYIATDNYDGDLTKKVTREEDDDFILYQVSDSNKNKSKVKRRITYEDKENPIFDLKGMETYYMTVGTNYEDPEYTVTDNCDGDLKEKTVVESNVDTSTAGTYSVTYTVKDKAGNEAKSERKVVVSRKVDANSGAVKNGVIYLTFDDGPSALTTGIILDILKEEGVKATFFVTNSGPDELIKREDEEGHTVALHTATHDYAQVYASVDAYFNDLQSVHDRVYNITGKDARIIRFPGGSSNTVSRRYSSGIMSILTEEVLNRGYRYYDWNISSGDAGGTTQASGVYQNVINGLSKDRPNMILMHDIKTHTRDALRDIIKYGKENGYTFEPITMNTAMVRQKVNN